MQLITGQKERAVHCWTARKPTVSRQTMRSVDRVAQVPSTLETLPPTERIEAIAATAISETISVYSMTTAPCVFIIRRRKSDSMTTPNLK